MKDAQNFVSRTLYYYTNLDETILLNPYYFHYSLIVNLDCNFVSLDAPPINGSSLLAFYPVQTTVQLHNVKNSLGHSPRHFPRD